MNTFVVDLPENSFVTHYEISNGHYITFEEYLKMDNDGVYLEWVDGKVEAFTVNNLPHQEIIAFLLFLLKMYGVKYDAGRVVQAGYAMKLGEQKRGCEPDLVFVKKENAERLKFNYLDGAADIAVEVVSPESVERDYETKFVEYERAKIREYWLIDPARQRADFYVLDDAGKYQQAEIADGVFYSQTLDKFFLRVEWLWQDELPTVAALRELNLI